MKIQFTFLTLNRIKITGMIACLSLLFSSQLFAQHQRPHFWRNDSTFVWNDSNHIWSDTNHFPPPPPPPYDSGHVWNDSGHVWHDTLHFPPPPHCDRGHAWNDSGHTWIDSNHFPPPPPPQDSGHTWNDSGHAWNDTNHFPPPPPPPHDSGHAGCDSNHFPPPPPQDSGHAGNDSGHCPPPPPHHGGRFADTPNPSTAVSISIYPNPIVESAVLHIENTSGNVTFRMYGINGRLVMERELTNGDFQLDKTNLGAGVYFYEINDGNTSVSKGKLIFQ